MAIGDSFMSSVVNNSQKNKDKVQSNKVNYNMTGKTSSSNVSPTASINTDLNSAASQASKSLPNPLGTGGNNGSSRSSGSGSGSGSGSYSAPSNVASTPKVSYDDTDDEVDYTTAIAQAVKEALAAATKQSQANYSAYESKIADLQDEITAQQKAYDTAQQQQALALQAARDSAVSDLNAQKTDVTNDYNDMYRQLYLQKMNAEKNINQQLAAQGVTGGQSESTLLGMNTNYSDALRQGKQGETKAQSELDQAITNANLATDKDIASSAAENAIAKANSYTEALQNAINQYNTMYQYQTAQDSENRNYNYQLAMSMLNSGVMPDDTTLSSAGINKSDAQSIVNAYSVAAAQKASSGGSGSGSSSNKYNGSIDNAYANYLAGTASADQINALYDAYEIGSRSQSDLNKVLSAMGMKTPTATSKQSQATGESVLSGYTTGTNYGTVYNNVSSALRNKTMSKSDLRDYVNEANQAGLLNSASSNSSQYKALMNLIDQY